MNNFQILFSVLIYLYLILLGADHWIIRSLERKGFWKQKTRQLQRKTHSRQCEEDHQAWKESLLLYKKELCKARNTYFSSLTEENKNNPKFLFNTVARLTKNPSTVEPCIPSSLSSNDFLTFMTEKIVNIRKQIGNSGLQTTVWRHLNIFCLIDLSDSTHVFQISYMCN